MPSPVDLASATCGACGGPLARLLSCPHCQYEMLISRDYYGQFGGREIACAQCNQPVLLKFD